MHKILIIHNNLIFFLFKDVLKKKKMLKYVLKEKILKYVWKAKEKNVLKREQKCV